MICPIFSLNFLIREQTIVATGAFCLIGNPSIKGHLLEGMPRFQDRADPYSMLFCYEDKPVDNVSGVFPCGLPTVYRRSDYAWRVQAISQKGIVSAAANRWQAVGTILDFLWLNFLCRYLQKSQMYKAKSSIAFMSRSKLYSYSTISLLA
jgi:hypothetical protein